MIKVTLRGMMSEELPNTKYASSSYVILKTSYANSDSIYEIIRIAKEIYDDNEWHDVFVEGDGFCFQLNTADLI